MESVESRVRDPIEASGFRRHFYEAFSRQISSEPLDPTQSSALTSYSFAMSTLSSDAVFLRQSVRSLDGCCEQKLSENTYSLLDIALKFRVSIEWYCMRQPIG